MIFLTASETIKSNTTAFIGCWSDAFSPLQSYGVEHLLTFANLRQLGLLVEQQPGETLTAVESKVGKLVNDKAAG